ncbi:MAG TPA: hypothetical protein VGM26_15150 [Rhizomicrobium sp.]|jgi:hypothetical protein
MNHTIRWRVGHKFQPLVLAASAVILLAVAAAIVWSRGGLSADARLASRDALLGAFHHVERGRTSQSGLVRLGFDPVRLQAHTLSGLGVQEYFMPVSSRAFDRLDPAIRDCFDAPDRCKVVIFPLAPPPEKGGFMSANAAPRASGRFVFLLKNGRVAYKAVIGS